MSDSYDPHLSSRAGAVFRSTIPRVVPIDEAMQRHISQSYWDWCSLFDRDNHALPVQHPDFVLAELERRQTSKFEAAVVRTDFGSECHALGILFPKSIRTGQVGGIGPGWTLHGLRLVGGRFLSQHDTYESQSSLLIGAVRYCSDIGADFLLIEDLDEQSPLYGAVINDAAHGARRFAAREVQPRLRIEFPESRDQYFGQFSSRSLSKFRRSLKKFGATRLERITEVEQIPDFLKSAHEISKQSWQSRQFGLRIRNDDAELRQMSILAQHGHLRSYVWWINDVPAAFAVCHQHRGRFYYEEIAYCQQWGQFSPGRVMLHQIVEDLYAFNPPRWFDFGGGDAEYKRQFSNRESRSGTIWLAPRTWRTQLTQSYLSGCRGVRSTVREAVRICGLATKARQWIRRTPVTQAAAAATDDSPTHATENAN